MKSRTENIAQLKLTLDDFIDYFCLKQGLIFENWVGDSLGGIASFTNDMNFIFSDIVIDVMYDIPAGTITEWYSSAESDALKGKPFINYNSYIKGFRQ